MASERSLKEGLEEARRVLNGPADLIFKKKFPFPPRPTQGEAEAERAGKREPRPPDPVEDISQVVETQIPSFVAHNPNSEQNGGATEGDAMETREHEDEKMQEELWSDAQSD